MLPLLTVHEVATSLRTTPDAIYKRIRRGTLPAVRDGKRFLVPASAIDAIVRLQPAETRGANGLQGLPPKPGMEFGHRDPISIRRCTKGKAKWLVDIYLYEPGRTRPHNVRRRSPHESKVETRRWAQQLVAQLTAKASAPDTNATSPSIAVVCERWLATQTNDLPNKHRHARWLRLVWGEETPVGALTHEQVVGLVAALRRPLGPQASERSRARRPDREGRPRHRRGEGLAPGSIRSVCQTANRVLAFATSMGWRSAAKVPLPRLPVTDAEWLLVNELRTLLDHSGEWRLAVMLGARAGLRRGEIVELRWKDVDLPNQRIRVARAFRRNDAKEWVVSTCKGQAARTVTIPPDLVATLREAEGQRGDLVVTQNGERVIPWVLSEALPKILQAAGIYRPGLGVHALRHTYCSHLAQGGAPAKAIQLLAGHKSERTTDRYMHLSPMHVSQAIACLPEI